MEVKTYYEQALVQDPKMSFALINLGMWYYYVPGIAGGDKQKTYEFVKKSVENASTPSEEYSLLYMVITKTSGCIVAMIPAGMFLLTSVALAVSVIRLAKKK